MSLSLTLCALTSLLGSPQLRFEAPTVFIEGEPFEVTVEVTAPDEGAAIAAWLLTPGAFTVDGAFLQQRDDAHRVSLAPGAKLTIRFDLGKDILNSDAFKQEDFKLGYAEALVPIEPIQVQCFERAPAELDFMSLPVEELSNYQVILRTNRGDMIAELWPDVAPMHVRNFLDLAYVGFYDGTVFHRVSPGFMIQGGDPTGTGNGKGPRQLEAEFNDRKHLRGVLSMARVEEPDSASCQFFIMHAAGPQLDNKYTAFGQLLSGHEVIDRIANAGGRQSSDGTYRPEQPQRILRAIALKASKKKPEEEQ